MTESAGDPTSSTILGPFWSPNAPFRERGGSIIQDPHNGQVALMHGKVTDLVTKKGIPDAVVDIWQASWNGKYDFQDPENQTDNNLRGKFRTDENGDYWFYCLRPTAYSLPTDGKADESIEHRRKNADNDFYHYTGPAGTLLTLLDRHPMRPAHIHLMASPSPRSPPSLPSSNIPSKPTDHPPQLQSRHHPDLPLGRPLPLHRLRLRRQERPGRRLQAAQGRRQSHA